MPAAWRSLPFHPHFLPSGPLAELRQAKAASHARRQFQVDCRRRDSTLAYDATVQWPRPGSRPRVRKERCDPLACRVGTFSAGSPVHWGGVAAGGASLSLGKQASAQAYPIFCSWAGNYQVGYGLIPAPPHVVQDVQAIMAAIRFPVHMQVFWSGVQNAAATVIGGLPAIIYSPDLMNHLHSCDPVAPLSVLAHEVGHHANLDMNWAARFKHPWQKELGADWVSGLAMRRLGIHPERAQNGVLCSLGPFSPESPSHPGSQRRLQAVRSGWHQGQFSSLPTGVPSPRQLSVNPAPLHHWLADITAPTLNASDDRGVRPIRAPHRRQEPGCVARRFPACTAFASSMPLLRTHSHCTSAAQTS